MTWTINLPYQRPPKGLSSNDRTVWQVKARSTAEVRRLVVNLVLAQRIPKMNRVSVEVVWVVPTKHKRDADGPDPMCKAIFDAIGSDRGVSARLVPDDDPAHMEKPRLRIEHRPGSTAHFEVTIRDLAFRPETVDQLAAERLT